MSWLDRFFTSKNYNAVQDEGTDVAPQPTLDFVGTGVEVTNDATNSKSIVTITAGGGSVPTGTGVYLVSGGAMVAAAGTVNLASGTYVTGTLAASNGGTGLTSTSSFVTLTGSQTLTNKTITAPIIATISNTGTLTLPTSTDTLVGRATTDTLTNKTLTAPIIASISNTGTLTLPTSTDTLVGRATTDTLTNKTLTSPVISSPDFGSSTIATSGYYKTSGNVATVGQMRFAHGDKFCVRNSGNSADATFWHTSGDTQYLGLNSGFTDLSYQFIFCPSQTIYIGVASNYFLIVNNNLLEINAPMLGYSGAEFALHGAVVSAMGDANYTAATADKRVETISVTAVMTAGRTITFPHPSSLDRSYKKMIRNEATTLQTLTVSTGTGTTIAITSGNGQWLEFTTGGVRKAGDPFGL